MITVVRYSLRRLRGQTLGWGIALALLALMIVSVYDAIAAQQEQVARLVASYPPELMAFFGASQDALAMFTPEGFISFEFFSLMPVVVGIFAVLMGSGLLVGDEEKGTLDLIMAHPVSRTALFLGRMAALALATAGILAIVWLGFLLGMRFSTLSIAWDRLLRPFVSLLAVLLLFEALALLLSMVLPSRRLAATVSGSLLVASYFVTSLARVNEDLEAVARFSPLNYLQTADAFDEFNLQWVAGLLLTAAIFSVTAWWRFQRRDIRVGGEGGWQVPSLSWRRIHRTA